MDLHLAFTSIEGWLRPSPASASVDVANALFRISLGAMIFFIHGVHKLCGALARLRGRQAWQLETEVAEIHVPMPFASALLATVLQLAGGILLALGLATRPVALVLTVTLSVAIYQNVATSRDPQLAVLYVLGVATLVLWGGGRFSMDALLWPLSGGGRS